MIDVQKQGHTVTLLFFEVKRKKLDHIEEQQTHRHTHSGRERRRGPRRRRPILHKVHMTHTHTHTGSHTSHTLFFYSDTTKGDWRPEPEEEEADTHIT